VAETDILHIFLGQKWHNSDVTNSTHKERNIEQPKATPAREPSNFWGASDDAKINCKNLKQFMSD